MQRLAAPPLDKTRAAAPAANVCSANRFAPFPALFSAPDAGMPCPFARFKATRSRRELGG